MSHPLFGKRNKPERTYRVVMQDSRGKRLEMTVRADSEADALLTVHQKHPKFQSVSARAVPVTKA